MFEELNQHRAAVAEQIQKACEIGFTGNELEKAHKVGDIHPNGKWVWTQLPSGRYDWRVIKKTSAPAGGAAPSTAQKTAQSSKKEEEVKGFVNILKQKPNERYLEQMDVDELKRFKDVANKCWLDDENLNRSTRLQCREWRDLAKKEIASKDEEARSTQQENEYRKQHPNSVTKNSDIQQQASSVKKKDKSKVSAFVTKTVDEIAKNKFWKWDENSKGREDAIKKLMQHEALAKKIMGTSFPAAIGGSPMNANETTVEIDGDKLIFGAYKTEDDTSWNPGSSNHYFIRREGVRHNLASGSTSGRWKTTAEVKKMCKIDAIVLLLAISKD